MQAVGQLFRCLIFFRHFLEVTAGKVLLTAFHILQQGLRFVLNTAVPQKQGHADGNHHQQNRQDDHQNLFDGNRFFRRLIHLVYSSHSHGVIVDTSTVLLHQDTVFHLIQNILCLFGVIDDPQEFLLSTLFPYASGKLYQEISCFQLLFPGNLYLRLSSFPQKGIKIVAFFMPCGLIQQNPFLFQQILRQRLVLRLFQNPGVPDQVQTAVAHMTIAKCPVVGHCHHHSNL